MIEKFHALLREHGRSVTRSRTKLFEYLQKSGPVSVPQFMRDNIGIADRASLYRTLVMFRELGVVEDRIITGRRLVELTDVYDSHHHHLTCNVCGSSTAIIIPEIEQALIERCRDFGFEADSHVIEMTGRCAKCRASNPYSDAPDANQ
jgi:Fur family ferric uptake transcriptional regulator